MMNKYKELDGIEQGDWVRFYQNIKLVIATVEYLYRDNTISEKYAATDLGCIAIKNIFEIRKPIKHPPY